MRDMLVTPWPEYHSIQKTTKQVKNVIDKTEGRSSYLDRLTHQGGVRE